MERALDIDYAQDLGVDLDSLLISQVHSGEMGFKVIEKMIAAGVKIIVGDSIAAMVPEAEIAGDMGDAKMGLHARLMSQGARKLTALLSKKKVCMIFTNQLREKIGVMFGNPEVTTGGNAMRFWASLRLKLTKRMKEYEEGAMVTGKFIKNKCAPPLKKAEFMIEFGKGVNIFQEVVDIAIEEGIIAQAGSWYSYGDTKIGQGKEKVAAFLDANADIYDQIYNDLRPWLA